MKLVQPARKAHKANQEGMEFKGQQEGLEFKANRAYPVLVAHVGHLAKLANVLLNASKQWVKRMRFIMHVLREIKRDPETYEL